MASQKKTFARQNTKDHYKKFKTKMATRTHRSDSK